MAEANIYDLTHPRWRDEEIARLRRWKDRAIELMLVNPTAEAEEIRLILEKEFGH